MPRITSIVPVVWAMLLVSVLLWLHGGVLPSNAIALHELVRHAGRYPVLFLDPWAGPLFVCAAYPWMAFDTWALPLFNAFCFVVTAFCAGLLFGRRALGASLLFPVLLLAAPVYRAALLAGTNEILFSMLMMIAMVMVHRCKYVLSVIVISLLPLVRPEWIVVVPCFVLWLAGMRAWRSLPWVMVGPLVVLFRGGSLPWIAQLDDADVPGPWVPREFFEPWMMAVIGLGAACWALLWWLRAGERGPLWRTVFLAMVPALLIVGMHPVLTWLGLQLPSAGSRTGALVWPLASSFALVSIGRAVRWMMTVRLARGICGALALLGFLIYAWPFAPEKDRNSGDERAGLREWLDQRAEVDNPVAFNDPLWAHQMGLDPWMPWSLTTSQPDDRPAPGSRIWWWSDAHAPRHLRVPLEDLLRSKDMHVQGLTHFAPAVYDTLPPRTLWTFSVGRFAQYRDTVVVFRHQGHDRIIHRLDRDTLARQYHGRPCLHGTEFPIEFADLPINAPEFVTTEVIVSGVMQAGDRRMEWVLSEEGPEGKVGYWPHAVWSGPFEWRMALPARGPGVRTKLYIWDRTPEPFCIADLQVLLIRTYKVPG